MKKLILVVLIVAIPALVFADFQIGAVGLYNRSTSSTAKISPSDFTYGLETRLNLWILQGGISALYFPGDTYLGTFDTVIAMTDVGVAIDLWILRLGAGVGPNYAMVVDTAAGSGTDAQKFGFNMKLAADLNLGNLGLGVVGYYYLEDLADLRNFDPKTMKPMLGVTLLFKLF